jgi:hypothetical protein
MTIADAGKVLVMGAGQEQVQLSCGAQKPARRVKIEYTEKTGGAAEVVSVEFLP